ncbi:MAG TPA: hypothetical protein OIM61_09120 [Clostridiaceae bacterium]|nr:hypothetical protein [Clostridiaceae bacterium]HJJ19382.1 hypothetical protein [Clostridiaceae bacterium]
MNKKKYVCIIIVLIVVISIFIGKLLLNYKNFKIAYVFENNIIQDESSNEILEDAKFIPNELQENTQIEETISYNQNAKDVESVEKKETMQEEKPSQKQETISNNNKTITKNETIKNSNTNQEKQQKTTNNQMEETKQSNPQKVETQDKSNKTLDNYTEIEVKVAEKKECDGNNHKMGAGNTGLWFETKAQADNYYNSQQEKWGKLWENDEITKEEYLKKCPSGYEVWTCPQCKKWTINFYYR